jgi:hypothetical protein
MSTNRTTAGFEDTVYGDFIKGILYMKVSKDSVYTFRGLRDSETPTSSSQ